MSYLFRSFIAICFIGISIPGFAVTIKSKQKALPPIENIEFIKNNGQLVDMENNPRPDILYTGDLRNANVFLKKTGLSYVMTQIKGDDLSEGPDNTFSPYQLITQRIDADFVGCNDNVEIKEQGQLDSYFNYYYAHCPQGITNVKAYRRIDYKNIYDNIDLSCYAIKNNSFKYDFIVNPGGNVNAICIAYSGTDNIQLIDGRLKINTAIGELGEWMPRIYQKINDRIIDIKGNYTLQKNENKYVVKIKTENYDTNYPLIIDPWVTYYGGSGNDECISVAADQLGNALAAGYTGSANFPITTGVYQTSLATAGFEDAFIVKFDFAGARQWATYYGSSKMDRAYGVYCDGSNNVIFSGITHSTDFPYTAGAFQTAHAADVQDAILVKLDPLGTRIWATYYGGNGPDMGHSVTIDNNNDIFMGGYTRSNDLLNSTGTFQPAFSGGQDAFITKFNSAGNNLWLSYFGGTGYENTYYGGICVDPSGNVAITGGTGSTDIPLTGFNFQNASAGSTDGYVAVLNGNGGGLWTTYIGGAAIENAVGIDADSFGNFVIVGYTASNNFPTTAGSYQAAYAGGSSYGDAFLIKFNSTGTRLWATYFGGTSDEEGLGIAIDDNDNINICGDTYSANLPVTTACSYKTTFGGAEDNYMAKFDDNGNYICSTYIGGAAAADDEINYSGTIASYGGFVYVVGITAGQYPITPGAYKTTYGGGTRDGFVMQLCGNACGKNTLSVAQSADETHICTGTPVNYTGSSVSCDTTGTTWSWIFSGATPSTASTTNPSGIIYNTPGSYQVKLVVNTPCGKDSVVSNNYIVVTSLSPIPAVASSDTTILKGGMTSLSVSTGVSYNWSPAANLSCTTCQSPVASPKETTLYQVIVTDANGCTSIDSILVTIEIVCGELFVPSAFSPNADGQNDIAYLYANCIKDLTFAIYNRWGEKVFETTDITKGWDGIFRGEKMNSDVFAYTVHAIFTNKEEVLKYGSITLLR